MDSKLANLNEQYAAGKIDFPAFVAAGQALRDDKPKRAQVTVYRTDAVVNRRSWTPACAGTVGERGKIGAAPSSRSLRNLVFTLNNCDVPMRSMLTLTMSPLCHQLAEPGMHRKAFKLALQRLRDTGIRHWVWVREFQSNGSVHWHVFTERSVAKPGDVNEDMTRDWIDYWSSLYWDRIHKYTGNVKAFAAKLKRSRWHMENGNGGDFRGCCRFEELKTEAAGRYASKEGAKRFQKIAPGDWMLEGGGWWRAARCVECTPIKTAYVNADSLSTQSVTIGNGNKIDVAMKLQYSLGLKLLGKPEA